MKRMNVSQRVFGLFMAIAAPLFLTRCAEEEIKVEPTTQEEPTGTHTKALATAPSIACSSCTFLIPAGKTTIDGNVLGVKPGDVVCFNAATVYSYITLINFNGTSDSPITITNCGGEVTLDTPGKPFVLKIANSKYFKLTGGNTNNAYGIKLKSAAKNGLVLGPFVTNFTVDHIEVSNVGFAGIMAKTDPTCDAATWRGNYTMRNVSFHNNYIHDTVGEGFYIGHTSFGGASTACGTKLPHTIEGVKVYRNIVRNSGWDGIQVSSATKGALIYSNTVENYSTANNPDQRGGICLGGGTGGVCHSNYINGGNGSGLVIFGLADNLIHNNIIVNANGSAIFCDERTAPGAGYVFLNNTIINPKGEGIKIYAETVPNNVFANNIIVNPGSYGTYGQNAYVMKLSNNVKMDMTNNYFTLNINDLKFVNPTSFNYRLTSASPVIDKGRSIATYNITRDFYSAERMKGAAYDIGASEF